MLLRTHKEIDRSLSGEPLIVEEGRAVVTLLTHDRMRADERGLLHGGFIFSLADYCAMLTVNEPTVVLAHASVQFKKPVVVGDFLRAEGELTRVEGKKRWVKVRVFRGDEEVFEGDFLCVVPEKHVLDR
ncbi:thioesterase superfamily protein [Thermocrinis albus DSM 14484]|uniref:Thioesterase superfamily protein n=1 Tax=Thermocrinis albus (strain DSM 14484 / JCM 11386 / HI 11/12) TaxID=638303 RepID=D3SPM5_THEAH|nr:PaaI family thioesterase [Thermocrinis albus]ADC89112.1 thioesterase superfamily protein [Thermocrinis albus DSM 14484]